LPFWRRSPGLAADDGAPVAVSDEVVTIARPSSRLQIDAPSAPATTGRPVTVGVSASSALGGHVFVGHLSGDDACPSTPMQTSGRFVAPEGGRATVQTGPEPEAAFLAPSDGSSVGRSLQITPGVSGQVTVCAWLADDARGPPVERARVVLDVEEPRSELESVELEAPAVPGQPLRLRVTGRFSSGDIVAARVASPTEACRLKSYPLDPLAPLVVMTTDSAPRVVPADGLREVAIRVPTLLAGSQKVCVGLTTVATIDEPRPVRSLDIQLPDFVPGAHPVRPLALTQPPRPVPRSAWPVGPRPRSVK
jgi:hypothetical protein